jgi:glutathione synthase/RimK-type ligase-like ATP-grasp enzyme
MQFVIIGNPENRRVTSFCEAAQSLGHQDPIKISYAGWSGEKKHLTFLDGSILKIDSPGENSFVRNRMIARGMALNKTAFQQEINAEQNSPVKEDISAIRHMRAWYAGYCSWLDELSEWISHQPSLRVMNKPEDIKLHFDKPRCQTFLQQHQIPVPFLLPPITSFDDLLDKMRQHRLLKVFIKPAHASSASGVIAFRRMGDKMQAITSAEMVEGPKGIELYNSLTIRTYTKPAEIAALVECILQENILVEEWLPKATLMDRFFDIRVLVIAGKARHTVIRTSRHHITNLHLGNKRGDMQEFITRIGEDKLREVKTIAERAAACFPGSLYMGIDILITADLRKIVVLETNAFGDLLPRLIDEGETCYEAQIRAMTCQKDHFLC